MEMLLDIRKALQQEAKYADADDEDEQQDVQAQLEENEMQIEDTQAKVDELGPERMTKTKMMVATKRMTT
jgi:hypothetical protein